MLVFEISLLTVEYGILLRIIDSWCYCMKHSRKLFSYMHEKMILSLVSAPGKGLVYSYYCKLVFFYLFPYYFLYVMSPDFQLSYML